MWLTLSCHQLNTFLMNILKLLRLLISKSLFHRLLLQMRYLLEIIDISHNGIIIIIVFSAVYSILVDSCVSVSVN